VVGGINDEGYNQRSYEGLMRAQLDFGIQVRWIESQRPEDYAVNLSQLVSQGCGLIVSVSFLMVEATEQVALANPNVKFAIVDAYSGNTVPNLLGLNFDLYEAAYMAGALAGLMTQSDVVGIVAGMEIPVVISCRTGFEAGAIAHNPTVTRLGVYIPSFTDPALGAQIASDFMSEGADVIFGCGGLTGSGAILHAAQNDAWAIGVDIDEYFTTFGGGAVAGSRYLLSSAVKYVDNGVYDTVVDYLAGDFTAGTKMFDLSNNGVGLAPFHEADPDVPQHVRDTLATIGYNRQVVTAVVTPQGGSIASLDGLVDIQFAAGAFPNQVEVFLQPQVGQPTGNLLGIGRFFEVGVVNPVAGAGAENTSQASTVHVQYRNHDIVGLFEASIGLYWWDGHGWVKEQSSVVNTATNTVTATTSHLGRFAVLGERSIPVYLPLLKIRAS
jgi:basic membrane lipoprotein Med (substrate-binding protein (PBP1-ABC) superfamily)